MPRIPRVVLAGVPFHVTQRGNRRGQVFFTDGDRLTYLRLLGDYAERFSVEILAYCLMSNHVHLVLVPTTQEGLHRMLKPVHMRYAQVVNRAMGWTGHLWQGRFFSSALDEVYLWAAIRYVERNPVRARLVYTAEEYAWSSAAAHCGGRLDPVLTRDRRWQQLLDGMRNWSTWLAQDDEQEHVDALRRNAQAGTPCGSTPFLKSLEAGVGRSLPCRSQGPPRKPVPEKG